jgi:Leucine-rich repeat (LRR) protein
MKFFTALISDSIKKGITNTTERAGVRCSTGKHNTTFCYLALIARHAYRRLVCFSSLVAFFSFLLGPALAQLPEHAPSRETDSREWENIDTGRSILDQDERFRLKAEARRIFLDRFHTEMPVVAISAVKPVAHTGMNICDRTAVVMNAILSKIPGTNDCAEITSTQLAAITGTLSLSSKDISSLKAGDFDGLISLASLNLWRNSLVTLPGGIFDDLTSLTSLDLSENALVMLPDSIFGELSSLDVLGLGKNDLITLPDSIFDELSSLEGLYLNSNDLVTLPDGIFDPLTSLRVLDLERNYLATLPDGIFDELISLDVLGLGGNNLDTLPDGIFDDLTSLGGLILYDNGLDTLPDGIFDELTSLTSLDLWSNNLVTLPKGIFDEPTSLTWLFLDGNDLDTLPDGIFDELTSLTWLGLGSNDLSILPDGIFDELTSLTWLHLNENDLSALPDGIFDELTSLTWLKLGGNNLSTLPVGIFDELTSLTELDLSENNLSALPDGIFDDLTKLYSSNSVGLHLQDNPGAPFRPIVNASTDLTVQPGTEVSIPGSVTGPWGSFVRWTWTQVDGPDSDTPASGALPLTGGDTTMPSFTAPMTEGELHFRLIATPGHEGTPPEANGYAISDPDWITVRVNVATNVADVPLVVDFDLLGNYPNPFNPSTTILLDLPETAAVSVDIFNMLGQRIHREDFPTVAAGPSRHFPLKVSHLPSGVYIYKVTAQMEKDIHHASGRMTFIK